MIFLRSPILALVFLATLLLGFGTYRLTESPGTWVDEGMIDQLAINLAEHGVMGIQTAPGHFDSGAYMTAGFPLLFPLALVFKIFGTGILEARMLMLLFAFLLAGLIYVYLQKEFSKKEAFFSVLLLVLFPPFYAYAKNVLGEVPGLMFFFLFLFLLRQYEELNQTHRPCKMLAIGLALGLCVVTKPVFLPLLGALGLVTILSWWKKSLPPLSIAGIACLALGFIIPAIVWFSTQFFPTDSAKTILSFYANPYGLERIPGTMVINFLRFFSEGSPMYVAMTFGAWIISIYLRIRRGKAISFAEQTALSFSGLVLLFYLRTPGWYKYFFVPQIIGLVFLPASLKEIFSSIPKIREKAMVGMTCVTCMLAIFHMYMLTSNSFVEESYHSTRSASLVRYFSQIDSQKEVFVYRAPETVIFLPKNITYHQYILVNKGLSHGEKEFLRIGVDLFPDIIISATDGEGQYYGEFFPGYSLHERVDRYAVLTRM